MRRSSLLLVVLGFFALALLVPGRPAATAPEVLPPGVRAVWDLDKAYREQTSTRERVCLNGLWRWQPAEGAATEAVPSDQWGYFQVPGCWPGISDYLQKESQTVFAHPDWKGVNMAGLTAAWYQREITVPAGWQGRRILLRADCVNSLATVFVDGKRAGELRFPGGNLDLTASCRAGEKHLLSLEVIAAPLKAVMLAYIDTNHAREVRGSVPRRGLCGDVFLVGEPVGARISGVQVETSVSRKEIAIDASLAQLEPGARYTLRAEIRENGRPVHEFAGVPFGAVDAQNGRIVVRDKWLAPKLWDLTTPGSPYELQLSLLGDGGKVLDAALPTRFGFREFRIQGRDFYLNGTRIFLSAVPLDNAQVSAAAASYSAARESLLRLKSLGVNFVYTHNYGCEPGSHLSFEEILRAADDVGMLVALSQPHYSQYDWNAPDADRANGYARHAEYYVGVAGNHPSVVAYAMSHNATGYDEDMNPDLIDGIHDPRSPGEQSGPRKALRAEAIVKSFDPGRIVYHHSSGNLGSMHTMNFYPDFVPIQELSDWYEHWATVGVKPVFMCEYGAPFSWDWSMYRGWYQGTREWGSAAVPWEFCLAEWNAQFLGDSAYRLTSMERRNLEWEAQQFRAGRLWHRWEYPTSLGSGNFEERNAIVAAYLTDNWRAYRTWGVSAISPWEYSMYWQPRPGLNKSRKALPVDWEHLQRPGFVADYIDSQYEQYDQAYERSDWVPTAAGEAVLRNNRPLLAYLGGKPARFTSKDHNFTAGEAVEKQLILINNSRATVAVDCEWSFGLPHRLSGSRKVSIRTGDQVRIPIRFALPAATVPGFYQIDASVRFSTGETQKDRFSIHVLPRSTPPAAAGKIALFDPRGETARLLDGMHVRYARVTADADLKPYNLLILGKDALAPETAAPSLERVPAGLKVIVFEQTAAALEQRLGFRTAEYGLRQVFPRIPDHPLLRGLSLGGKAGSGMDDALRDWRGEATLSTPRLQYTDRPRYGPMVKWCGLDVPRLWRCGCRGNVASVLIEKPARGDFLPVLDGGFSLQYSPLLEYREGRGMVLFCQVDVTGRTEPDPAAALLARNIVTYACAWKPGPNRQATYSGGDAGRRYLAAAGVPLGGDGVPAADRVRILGPGSGTEITRAARVQGGAEASGSLFIGLNQSEASGVLPASVRLKPGEHSGCFFQSAGVSSPLAGIGPADVQDRDPRQLPLVDSGAAVVGDGVLASTENGRAVLCQLAPWQFSATQPMNQKRTFRRTAFLLSRLLGNLGVHGTTPLLGRFHTPVAATGTEKRWLDGLYLDTPVEWDDPYRHFRW